MNVFDVFDLNFLRDAAALVDSSLERLDTETNASPDPDSFGIFDQIEYITGFGFVACQTYITAVVSRRRLEKREDVIHVIFPDLKLHHRLH